MNPGKLQLVSKIRSTADMAAPRRILLALVGHDAPKLLSIVIHALKPTGRTQTESICLREVSRTGNFSDPS